MPYVLTSNELHSHLLSITQGEPGCPLLQTLLIACNKVYYLFQDERAKLLLNARKRMNLERAMENI